MSHRCHPYVRGKLMLANIVRVLCTNSDPG